MAQENPPLPIPTFPRAPTLLQTSSQPLVGLGGGGYETLQPLALPFPGQGLKTYKLRDMWAGVSEGAAPVTLCSCSEKVGERPRSSGK